MHASPSSTRRPATARPASSDSGVSAVIAYARAQVGKWYLWGGAGPDRFDCSGLTMMAWREAGVYMDHYTGSQYNAGQHVSVHSLQPGDLVFFGPSVAGIHHMGLYIGNDTMIEAPHTGAQIRYSSIWRPDLIPLAVRP